MPQGEDLASLKQGAGLKKGLWIAYPSRLENAERTSADVFGGDARRGIN